MRVSKLLYAVVLASASLPAIVSAAYPERPIRLIISSAPGGSPDVVTRILAAELVKQMGQQIIIDNRPGGAQTIGTDLVVHAQPDGYTVGYANVVTLAINKALLPKQPYDTDRDLVLVGQFLSTYNLLAVPNSLPVKSVKELIDYARQNPGKLLNASSGNGTTGHLGGELFLRQEPEHVDPFVRDALAREQEADGERIGTGDAKARACAASDLRPRAQEDLQPLARFVPAEEDDPVLASTGDGLVRERNAVRNHLVVAGEVLRGRGRRVR